MFVKCRIEVQTSAGDLANDLISFSERALQPNGDVWLVRENKLIKSSVDVVDRFEWDNEETGKKEVGIVARVKAGDLKPGDSVVISPLGQVAIGTEVIISDEGAMAESDENEPEEVAATNGDEAEKTN